MVGYSIALIHKLWQFQCNLGQGVAEHIKSMSQFFFYSSSCIISVFISIFFIKFQWKRLSRPPYPPGPKGFPLIGNLRDIPTSDAWVSYAQWAREFDSSSINLKLPGAHLIVLNTTKAISDLFEKRSAIYSDRPRMTMISELVCVALLTPVPFECSIKPRSQQASNLIAQAYEVHHS